MRDAAALFLFVGGFLASVLTEFLCGRGSERCKIDWSPLYGNEAVYYGGHCGRGDKDAGLGDPGLSVSSLFLIIPLVYWAPSDGALYTPPVSAFLGVASFLFHAANTEASATLDFIGLNLLGPALVADFVADGGRPKTAVAGFLVLLAATVAVRVGVDDDFPRTQDVFNTYTYVTQSIMAAILLVLFWRRDLVAAWLPATIIVGGCVSLIVANNSSRFWACINTQLAEPHFWGHLLVAVGATLYCRALHSATEETPMRGRYKRV